MSKKLRNIGIVSLLTIVSRVLGLVRDTFTAWVFGLEGMQDAFYTAFVLPNLFRRLLGEGALAAVLVPKLQEELHARQKPGAFAVLSNVTTWLAVITGGIVVLGMVLLSQSRHFGFEGEDWQLVAHLSVVMFPYLAFVCVAAVLNSALNVLDRFTEPTLSPIWLNLAMIGSLGVAVASHTKNELEQVHLLCAGVLVGGFLQMAVPAGVLMREGWRPRFDLRRTPAVNEIVALMAPTVFGVAIYQINISVSRLIAYSLETSSASAFFLANRLMELPIGVFAIAVATVVYPAIARHAVEKNYTALASDYRKGLRLILVINIPAAVGLVLLSEPIVRLLFQHGRFTADKTAVMAPLLALFALGMPFFSITTLSTRAFYALKDTTTPVKIAALSFAINLGLTLGLKDVLGAKGLVIASTVAIIVQTIVLQQLLARRLEAMQFGELWRSLGKVAIASALMGAVVYGTWRFLEVKWPQARLADIVAIGGLIPVGVAVYVAAVWALKIEGREEFQAVLARLRGGNAKAAVAAEIQR